MSKDQKTSPDRSPLPRSVREQVEGFAMAILMAIGLKYFLLEAYEIPTPSMQPALMGSPEAGIHDRILVNKAAYLFRQPPKRWDIGVFQYPHNISQKYVKRIVGLAGEEIRIANGDLYRVLRDGNKPPRYENIRKPPHLQQYVWKLMYEQSADDELDKTYHFHRSTGLWKVEGKRVVAKDGPGGTSRTVFMPPDEPRDHYRHGYPEFLHGKIAAKSGLNTVSDLDWSVSITPEASTKAVSLWHKEFPMPGNGPGRAGCLRIRRTGDATASVSLEFFADARSAVGNGSSKPTVAEKIDEISFRPGTPVRVSFANYDDRLVASVDGSEALTIEYESPPYDRGIARVALEIDCTGPVTFEEARLQRDLFYEPAEGEPVDRTYTVPDDHFWMLGDNQKKSDDGRSWNALRIWVTEDGKLAEPNTGRPIEGNSRYRYRSEPNRLDADENPVYVPSARKLVFTDKYGEEHVIDAHHTEFEAKLPSYQFNDGEVRFVPRRYFAGRALATFWPANPFGWFRVGLIR